MKVKASELIGRSLDWAVAVCQNVELDENNDPIWFDDRGWLTKYSPSTDWSQGGPIIDALLRTGLVIQQGGPLAANDRVWVYVKGVDMFFHGPTLLIAVMRCYVSSKLGEEAEVPDELLESTQRSEK